MGELFWRLLDNESHAVFCCILERERRISDPFSITVCTEINKKCFASFNKIRALMVKARVLVNILS